MRIDCHVHIAAASPGHGSLSQRLLGSISFRFLRWKFGLDRADIHTENAVRRIILRDLEEARELDKAVVLAFDAVYHPDGRPNPADTHLFVTNDYVRDLARTHPKVLFGASVHPFRRDAVAELERCIAGGAALLKWLPVTQKFSPADSRCQPIYECLAHHRLPLLCHTGAENSVPCLAPQFGDPMLLRPALRAGVTVIAAHCGSRLLPTETSWVDVFCRMARDHENLYGDTAALSTPGRWSALAPILEDPQVRQKLVHGSDWPIIPLPPPRVGLARAVRLARQRNWFARDIAIKRAVGFDEEYFHRAGKLLRLSAGHA